MYSFTIHMLLIFTMPSGHIHLVKIPSGKFYSLEMKVTDHGKNPGPKSTNLRLVLYNERSLSGFDAGSVYVGSSRASVQISAIKGAKSIVPIYANVAFQDLEGIDVTIRYFSYLSSSYRFHFFAVL